MVSLVAPITGPIFQARAVLLLVESTVLAIIGVALVSLRVRDAWKLRTPWRADLILVCIATTLAMFLFIPGLMAGLNGFGTEQNLLSPQEVSDYLLWSDILVASWVWAICFCKLAIIALYSRVTQAAIRSERMVLWCIGLITVLCAIIQDVLLFATRHPHSTDPAEMNRLLAEERGPYIRFSIIQGSLSAVIDVVLMVYPIPIVAKMKCSKRTKISLYVVIAAGILPTAAVIGRTVILPSMLDFNNATVTWVPAFCWASAEVWLMIILGSLPPLRAYFARLFKFDKQKPPTVDDTVLLDTIGQVSTVVVQDMTKSKSNWEIV